MPRPYPAATLGERPRQSGIPGVLLEHRVGVDLGMRNRHEDAIIRPRCLELPRLRVLAVPDEILAALGLAGELEQALTQNHGAVHDTQRIGLRDGPGAYPPHECERGIGWV